MPATAAQEKPGRKNFFHKTLRVSIGIDPIAVRPGSPAGADRKKSPDVFAAGKLPHAPVLMSAPRGRMESPGRKFFRSCESLSVLIQ